MNLMKSHNKFLIITTFLLSTLFANNGLAADVTVEMLNRLDKQSNVFEPKIVRVNVGDTVLWKAKDKGHNVEFIKKGVPEGVGNLSQNSIRMLNTNLKFLEFTHTGAHLIKICV